MVRKLCTALFLVALTSFVLWVYLDTKLVPDSYVADYYINNSFRDTFSKNAVAGIYLNYRVFDSIFETLLLLISSLAVIIFSWRKEDEE